jgi:hypothetical protein
MQKTMRVDEVKLVTAVKVIVLVRNGVTDPLFVP